MSSVNKAILIGNLGHKPESRLTKDGQEIVTFSIATSESWKDKKTGERKQQTEWHKIIIFNQNLVKIAKEYLKKGSKVYIEGKIETRQYTGKDGIQRYTSGIFLKQYNAVLQLLDSKEDPNQALYTNNTNTEQDYKNKNVDTDSSNSDLNDEIPF